MNLQPHLTKKIDLLKHYNPRKTNDDVSFHVKFLRIVFLYALAYLPILVGNICLFFYGKDFTHELAYEVGMEKAKVFIAIGYVQTLFFSIINFGTIIICQIIHKQKKYINFASRRSQPKELVDTGLILLLITIMLLMLIFVLTSVVFIQLKANNKQPTVSRYIYQFTGMNVLYLSLLLIGNYFIYLSLTSGFNWIKIISWCSFSMIVELVLIVVFIRFHLIGIHFIVFNFTVPLVIVTGLRCIGFLMVYFFKIAYHHQNVKWYKICFKPKLFKDLLIACLLPSVFIVVYMIANIIQTLFIIYAYQINAHHDLGLGYLYQIPSYYVGKEDQTQYTFSTLFLSKFTIFNFIYLIYSPSKSFNIAMNDYSLADCKQFSKKIARARKMQGYNLLLNISLLTIGIFVAFAFKDIVNSLFSNIEWMHDPVTPGHNPTPNMHLPVNATILQLISQMSMNAMWYGILAYFFMEVAVNMRIIYFKFFKRNYRLFIVILLIYISAFTWVSFLLVFMSHSFFYGMSGFLVSYGIYGILSLPIIYLMMGYRLYNKYLKIYPELLAGISRWRFVWMFSTINTRIIKGKYNQPLMMDSMS